MLYSTRRHIRRLIACIWGCAFLCVAFPLALFARIFSASDPMKPRLVWGSAPVINNMYWSRAMRRAGYSSETFTLGFYSKINSRSDWDVVVDEKYRGIPAWAKTYLAFVEALFKYDVFFISCEGFFIGTTPVWKCQAPLWRLAGKKIVVIPYGGDAYVYRRVRSPALAHGLMMCYPDAARHQNAVARRLDYWAAWGDVVYPGFIGLDGVGRWDVLAGSQLHLDLDLWQASQRVSRSDGSNGVVRVAHSPNHRGFKGTEFLISAVEQLRSEGLQVELLLVERIQNSQVREILQNRADVLVEQLVMTGHGLSGVEGMAAGLPVVANLEDEQTLLPFRRWSFFSECPIVSASPETLVNVLRQLIMRPDLREELGRAGRLYVEKYHSLDAAQHVFSAIVDYCYGRRDSLINLYHPLLSEHPRGLPRIEHPLEKNRIVD